MTESSRQERTDAVQCANVISSLVECIKGAGQSQSKKCSEIKILKEKCCDENIILASTAFQGITHLVEKKVFIGSQTISSLISVLPSIKHYSPLVMTIGNILLFDFQEQLKADEKYEPQFNFTDKSHPFVIILKHDSVKSWDAIYCYINYILKGCENISYLHKINLLHSVFLYIFCNPTADLIHYKNELFSFLLKELDKPHIIHFIFQIIAWQNIDMNFCWLIISLFNSLLSSSNSDIQLAIGALTPLLAVLIKWLIASGHNPCLWIDLLVKSLKINNDGANSVLYILSDAILQTPTFFINNIISLCKWIICSGACNKYTAHKFLAVTLLWMVNPSSLAEPVYKNLEYVTKFLHEKKDEWQSTQSDLLENPYYCIIKSSCNEARMAVEISKISNSWIKNQKLLAEWLKFFFRSNNVIMKKKLQPFISGIYLCENEDGIVDTCMDILLEISGSHSELSFLQLCVTFFKLSKEIEPRKHLKYLQSLTKMANSKENIPLIIGIIETLKNDNSQIMIPVVIDMYLNLWKADNRTYPYLHKALFTQCSIEKNSWEVNVMIATALREICRLSPETHGKSLVPKLSELLNDCNNYASGVPSAIAIEAVIELCNAQVTDIYGTWKVLKPKLGHDKRIEVMVSLCKLFGEIPSLKPSGAEREALYIDIIPRLWDYTKSSDLKLIEAALKSLSKFSPESYSLKLLPNMLKTEVKLPKEISKTANNESREQLLDELDYIPGECWLECIKKIDPKAIKEVSNMLISLVEEEIRNLPRRFFYHPEETSEPTSYAKLPHSSICRSLVDHIRQYLKSDMDGKNVPISVTESLRILSSEYSKCFPPLDWSFLATFFTLNNECKKMSIMILVKQAPASKAGRSIFENYVKDSISTFHQIDNFLFLYPVLPFVCNALGPNTLRQFLEKTIRCACSVSLKTKVDCFEVILKNVKLTLENKNVPEPRKALLVSQIQNILVSIPPEHKIMKIYAEFAVVLPPKAIECMSSPSSWSEITSSKLKKSVLIRSALALQSDSVNPLAWFNECIEAVMSIPMEQDFVKSNILDVLRQKRDVYHGDWIVELMWRTQVSTSSVNSPESVKATLFLLDLFMACTVTLSGYDCLLWKYEIGIQTENVKNIFPSAVYELFGSPNWNTIAPKVIEWIYSLSKWKHLPRVYAETLEQGILILRSNNYCSEKNKWLNLFYLPTINNLSK